jgi:hypothetical protein
MATKAERYETERRLQKHAANGARPTQKRPSRSVKGAASATEDDPAGRAQAAVRSAAGTYALEVTRTSRPSRKSTRGSAGHLKTDAVLSLRRLLRASAPTVRASQRPGRHP